MFTFQNVQDQSELNGMFPSNALVLSAACLHACGWGWPSAAHTSTFHWTLVLCIANIFGKSHKGYKIVSSNILRGSPVFTTSCTMCDPFPQNAVVPALTTATSHVLVHTSVLLQGEVPSAEGQCGCGTAVWH